jgi:hypothetical protein
MHDLPITLGPQQTIWLQEEVQEVPWLHQQHPGGRRVTQPKIFHERENESVLRVQHI